MPALEKLLFSSDAAAAATHACVKAPPYHYLLLYCLLHMVTLYGTCYCLPYYYCCQLYTCLLLP